MDEVNAQDPQKNLLINWTTEDIKQWLNAHAHSKLPPEVVSELSSVSSGAELSQYLGKPALMDRFEELTGRQALWLLDKLILPHVPASSANPKKRKAHLISQSIEKEQDLQQDAKKVKHDLPSANKFFTFADDAVPSWSLADTEALKIWLARLIELNQLEAQQSIFGKGLQNVLPLVPFGKTWRIFEWFFYNPLQQQVEEFAQKVTMKSSNVQSSKVYLIYQVSGAGKTKLAYELSKLHYTIVIRFIDKTEQLSALRQIFDPTLVSHKYNKLDLSERQKLPYFSLAVTYAWIKAHIMFLDWYQNNLVNDANLSDEQKRLYFHLVQCNGSPARKFIRREFMCEIIKMNNTTKSGYVLLSTLQDEIRQLVIRTNVGTIAFDELLATLQIGTALFAHNEVLADDSNVVKIAASHQTQMKVQYQTSVLGQEDPFEAERMQTSFVDGVMHFIGYFGTSLPIVLTDTSKILLSYYLKYEGTRPNTHINEFLPEVYLSASNFSQILQYYFGTSDLSSCLSKYEGRALFFVQYFFFDQLMPELQKTKPTNAEEVELLIRKLVNKANIYVPCQEWANYVVEDFYEQMKKHEEIIAAVETGVATNAEIISWKQTEATKTVNMVLCFVSHENCYIKEPFMLEALAKREMETDASKNPSTF